MKMKYLNPIALLAAAFFTFNCAAAVPESKNYDQFINKMVKQHHFDKQQLQQLFKSVEIKQSILKAMSSPAEGLPWYKYRKIFLTDKRIQGGVTFWKEYEPVLSAVEQQTGVPAEIIIAIIGVETRYGGNTGSYRVIDALSTLGFAYPKRSKFFLSELEHFLILCRDQDMDPLKPTGSYAGAMGWPQFMPSSYRSYAADFEGDNKHDIWNNPADVIASVANYFVKHHWQPGQPVTFEVSVKGNDYKKAISKGLKPDISVRKLKTLNVQVPAQLSDQEQVRLLQFELEKGYQYWVGLTNFYVITRYNHSPLYAMAVYQLSQEILKNKPKPVQHKPAF